MSVNDVAMLARFLSGHGSLVVLTGAGVSTASGIPAYRDESGRWVQSAPIQFGEFARSRRSRQRYWARSFVGWPRFGRAAPNEAHRALAALEERGGIDTLITQNVDGLHARAGSRRVIDLHGNLDWVVCLSCQARTGRADFQSRLEQANPGWAAEVESYRADGDAEIGPAAPEDFAVPGCESCNGDLKPDVVMFGENVPRSRVEAAMDAVDRAEALLVVGSSLTVFSGFRFVRRAHESGKPIAILNRGATRGDDFASVKLEADAGAALRELIVEAAPVAAGIATGNYSAR